MAKELERLVLPELYKYFNQPTMQEHLRMVAWWGHSFEAWLKFEMVFALEPLMQTMKGVPWEYEEWDMERGRKGLGQVDLCFGGANPLYLQLKTCIPCGPLPPKFRTGPNSLREDIENVQAHSGGAAACLLFTLEHPGAEMAFEQNGFPPPEGDHKRRIELGKTWCDACCFRDKDAEKQDMYARFYYWTNDL